MTGFSAYKLSHGFKYFDMAQSIPTTKGKIGNILL